MRRTRVFETRDSDWKKKKFLLGRVGKNALFQADCLLCFLSVHTSGTRVSLEIFFSPKRAGKLCFKQIACSVFGCLH